MAEELDRNARAAKEFVTSQEQHQLQAEQVDESDLVILRQMMNKSTLAQLAELKYICPCWWCRPTKVKVVQSREGTTQEDRTVPAQPEELP